MAAVERIETQQARYFAVMDQLIDQTVVKHATLSEIYFSLYELVGAQIGYSTALREHAREVLETEQAERYLTRAAQVEAEVGTVFPTLLGYYSRRVLDPEQQASADQRAAGRSFEAFGGEQSTRDAEQTTEQTAEQTMEFALTERERAV